MNTGLAQYKVDCPFSSHPVEVNVYYAVNNGVAVGRFNGCDLHYHKCQECDEVCQAKTLQLFEQDDYAKLPIRERMLAQGFPDLESISNQQR